MACGTCIRWGRLGCSAHACAQFLFLHKDVAKLGAFTYTEPGGPEIVGNGFVLPLGRRWGFLCFFFFFFLA